MMPRPMAITSPISTQPGESCRSTDDKHRTDKVADCVRLTPRNIRRIVWLPPSCGYRLVAEGRDLYGWHPLISGDPETVHIAGISGRGRVISEDDAGDLEDHVVEWVDTIPPQAKKKPRR